MHILVYDKTESIAVINFDLVTKIKLNVRKKDERYIIITMEYTIGDEICTSYKPIYHDLLKDEFLSNAEPDKIEEYVTAVFAEMLTEGMKKDAINPIPQWIVMESIFEGRLSSKYAWYNLSRNTGYTV